MSASIFSKYCCALSASLQSLSNLLLHWNEKKLNWIIVNTCYINTRWPLHGYKTGVITSTRTSCMFYVLHCAPRRLTSAGWRINKYSWRSFVERKKKHKHSSNPLTEQSLFVGPVCTLNCASPPNTQWYHWAQRQVWGGQGKLCISLALFLSLVKGARRTWEVVFWDFSLVSPSLRLEGLLKKKLDFFSLNRHLCFKENLKL